MTEAWRIVAWTWRKSALSGEGAERFPGRWNFRGEPMVYLAGSRSLAILESFVHLERSQARTRLVLIRVSIPAGVAIGELKSSRLPSGWDRIPPPNSTRRIGSAWLRRGASAALRVPSVIVPGESILLVNPSHPLAPRIRAGKPERLHMDPRMWK